MYILRDSWETYMVYVVPGAAELAITQALHLSSYSGLW